MGLWPHERTQAGADCWEGTTKEEGVGEGEVADRWGGVNEETGSIKGTPPATNVMQIYGSSDRFLPKLLALFGLVI